MLEAYLKLPKPALGRIFEVFMTALETGRFSIRRDLSLVFLCGANKATSGPSERRNFLKMAIERELPHTRVVYAEKVMEELVKHGKTKNLLDIEHQITGLADWVLIVLESNSSFCELGAFAHQESRRKLLVVNDSKFSAQPSFINHGPLQAIVEDAAKDHVIWYPMGLDGIDKLDAIGMTLPSIVGILRHHKIREKVQKSAALPTSPNQTALFFLHDLIYMCGPITHAETIVIYKKIFGDNSYDEIKSLRGILHACDLIESKTIDGAPSYLSRVPETFINFGILSDTLMTAFRRYHFKHNAERLVNA